MLNKLGFQKIWNILKDKGLYPQFHSYEEYKEFQKKEIEIINASSHAYDEAHGNAVIPGNLPF